MSSVQPCDVCGVPVKVHAVSLSECYCSPECADSDLPPQVRVELSFLRWFYNNADQTMGPASDDVYHLLRQEYVELGGKLPPEYEEE